VYPGVRAGTRSSDRTSRVSAIKQRSPIIYHLNFVLTDSHSAHVLTAMLTAHSTLCVRLCVGVRISQIAERRVMADRSPGCLSSVNVLPLGLPYAYNNIKYQMHGWSRPCPLFSSTKLTLSYRAGGSAHGCSGHGGRAVQCAMPGACSASASHLAAGVAATCHASRCSTRTA